jgi:AraC-like DNA-binding protein
LYAQQAEIDPTLVSEAAASWVTLHEPGAGIFTQTAAVAMADHAASGWIRGANIRSGFSVTMADAHYHEQMENFIPAGGHFKVHVRLDGDNFISGAGVDSKVEAGRVSLLIEPADHKLKRAFVKRDTRIRAVTMVLTREFVTPLLSDDLPSAAIEFLTGPVGRFCHRQAAISPAMRSVSEQMLALGSGRLADMMLEAKSLELLYLWIEALAGMPDSEPLLSHNRKKAEALKALLQTDQGMTMSIAQLCRELAWNETQMMESFKQVTGTTISGYRQRLRMDQALTQLRTTDRTITAIALDAGYEHSGNFATAFKRSFGFSPRAARGH